jgi:hypothetical protein
LIKYGDKCHLILGKITLQMLMDGDEARLQSYAKSVIDHKDIIMANISNTRKMN